MYYLRPILLFSVLSLWISAEFHFQLPGSLLGWSARNYTMISSHYSSLTLRYFPSLLHALPLHAWYHFSLFIIAPLSCYIPSILCNAIWFIIYYYFLSMLQRYFIKPYFPSDLFSYMLSFLFSLLELNTWTFWLV